MEKVDTKNLPISNNEKNCLQNLEIKLHIDLYLVRNICDVKIEPKSKVFFGIKLEEDHVIEFILYSEQSLPFPYNLENLKFLKKLRLNGLQFERDFYPHLINTMKDLEYLDFSYCNFQRNIYNANINFANNKLKYLDLSNCTFVQNLAFEKTSSEIITLKLKNIQIKQFPESITNLINLEYLDLSNNPELTIEGSIFNLQKLKTLKIAESILSADLLNFENLKNLKCLNISSLGLSKIPDSIRNLVLLKELELTHNKIEDIPLFFYNLTNLTYLDLSMNHISSISEDISNLKKLRHFNLNFNNISVLPETFSNLKDLKSLYIISNRLESLPESFKKMNNLESLFLTNNKLKKFPQVIKSLNSLRKLYISDNPIENFYEIFDLNLSLEKKISLKEVHLNNIYSFKHSVFEDFKNLAVLIGTNNSGKSNLFKTFLNIKPFNPVPKEVLFSDTSMEQAEIKLIFEFSEEFLYNYIETMKNYSPKLRFVNLDHLNIVYNGRNIYWKTFLKVLIVKLKFNYQMAFVDQFGFQIENDLLNLISYKNEITDGNTDIKTRNIVWSNINFKQGNTFLYISKDPLNEFELRAYNIDSKKDIKDHINQHFTNFTVSFFFREFIEFYENIRYISEFRNFQEETDGDLNPQEIISNGGNFPIIIADYCYNIQKNRDFIQFLLNKLYPDVKHLWTEYRGKSKKPFILEFNDMRRTFNNVGKGMHQILIILTHLMQLEENSTLFIEEPELYIHPELQKKLLQIIRNFLPLHQIFITTHSPFYINSLDESLSIHEIQKINGQSTVKNVDSKNIYEVFNRLGLNPSDLLMYNGLLLVEGNTDIRLLKKLMADTLINNHIEIVPFEGKNKLHFFADHKILSNLIKMGFKFLIILDRDEGNKKIRDSFTGSEVLNHIMLLPVREIENFYLNPILIANFLEEYSSIQLSKSELKECIIRTIEQVISKNLLEELIRKSFLDEIPFSLYYNDKNKLMSSNGNDEEWLNYFYEFFQSKYWIESFNKNIYNQLFKKRKTYYENIDKHEKWKVFPGKKIRPLILKKLEEQFNISIPLEKLEENMKDNLFIKRELLDKIKEHFGFL